MASRVGRTVAVAAFVFAVGLGSTLRLKGRRLSAIWTVVDAH